MTWLVPAFFVTALLYAMAGFGGGSTYNALLVLQGADYRVLPAIALGCNIIVTAGGSLQFARHRQIPWSQVLPILAASVPMAFLGGRLPVAQWLFTGLLGVSLLVAGVLLIARDLRATPPTEGVGSSGNTLFNIGIGGGIGLLAGIVGIGGGIFLAPLLHLMNWNTAKAIAATACVFIMLNSVAGLGGQLLKLEHMEILGKVTDYAWLFPSVLAGGLMGNRITRLYLSPVRIRRITAVLILYVAVRLLIMTPELMISGLPPGMTHD